MTPTARRRPASTTRYQAFVSLVRRFDRDAVLVGLATTMQGWDGNTHDENGRVHRFLPWNVAGAAATAITRGTTGGPTPTESDLAWICYQYSNLEHRGSSEDPEFGLQLIGRFLSQQWPYQRLGINEWARTVSLFSDTEFGAGYTPEAMRDSWDEDLLGCTVRDFVSVGFCLYAAAHIGGRYPLMWDEGLQDVVDLHGGAVRFNEIAEANFLIDIDGFKLARRSHLAALNLTPGQAYVHEPFAYNPLISRPFVGGIVPGEWIAPCAPAVALRTSAIGVLYAGIEKWGERFTRDAGHLFEQYVGRHLRLIANASLLPEVSYRTSQGDKLSVDWLVILPEAVLLIECKNSVPATGVREGLDGFVEAHGRLAKGVKQLNATAQAITDRRSEFAAIPTDRPLLGFVVTLGNFDMANTFEIRSTLPTADIPIAIIGVDFLEQLAALDAAELTKVLLIAPEHTAANNVLEPRNWFSDITISDNPILQAAIDTVPIIFRATPDPLQHSGA